MWRSSRYPVFIFGLIFILFTLGFQQDRWRAVPFADVQYRRDVSEIYVMGRLVKSQQDGVFSAGGLLAIGGVREFSVDSRVIKNQYQRYLTPRDFKQYWIYKSTPGFQGILFSLFDRYTGFTPQSNLSIFRWSVSIFLAATLTAFCVWVAAEFGWLATGLVVLFVMASKWLTILGGNLYWCLGAFYLPWSVLTFMTQKRGQAHTWPLPSIFLWSYCLALAKILLTGFEFITAALVMFSTPFIFYGVWYRWPWKLWFQRLATFGAAMLAGILSGLLVLTVQVRAVLGSYEAARAYILFAWVRRTTGADEGWINPLDVVKTYLGGYAFDVAGRLRVGPGILAELLNGKYVFLIGLIVVASALFFVRYWRQPKTQTYSIGLALIVTCWYSMLAPLSWLIVFKEHAAIHLRLDYIVWQMPFLLYGMALIGFVIAIWFKPNMSGPRKPEQIGDFNTDDHQT